MKEIRNRIKAVGGWLFHEHISRKILAVFGMFFLFSFFLTYTLYSWASENQAGEMMEQSSRQLVSSVKNNLDEMVLNVNDDFNLLLKGGTLDAVSHLPIPEDRTYYDNILFTVLDSNHYLESIYLLDFSAHLYGLDKHDMKRLRVDATVKCPWYKRALEAGGGYILEHEAGGIFLGGYNSKFVSVIRTINSLETQKPQGFILMNIPETAISSMLGASASGHKAVIGLLDRKGEPVVGTSDFQLTESYQEIADICSAENPYMSGWDKDNLVSVLYMPEYDWHLIVSLPAQNGGRLGDLFLIASLIFLVNVGLMLICSLYISKSISTPIYELINMMNTVKNRDFSRISVKYPKSEMGILQDNYNTMVGEIDSLLSRLVEEQQVKQKAELHALFEQVKPHFLYNTLDAIGYMALTQEPEQTYEAIETLGSFYRQSLSQGAQMIPIEKEVTMVRDYVKLLRLRYGDLFEVEYEIEEACRQIPVPHLILQPLVENAVYHGIKPMGGGGLIQINICFEDRDRLKIMVKDNGAGIDSDTLSGLKDSKQIWNLNMDVSGTGIGLIGTIQRIYLIYGEQGTCKIQSETGKGTEIVFLMPINGKEGESHGGDI